MRLYKKSFAITLSAATNFIIRIFAIKIIEELWLFNKYLEGQKMKVLLIGEYSGVHNNLKKGLEELGVNVTLANTGDGYKKFKTNIRLKGSDDLPCSGLRNKVLERFNFFRMKKYDVIQFINPNVLYLVNYNHKKIFELMDHAKLTVVTACGCDNLFSRCYETINPQLCKSCLKLDYKRHKCFYKDLQYVKFESVFYNKIDMIIPQAWEYYKIIHEFSPKMKAKTKNLIPFAVDTESIKPIYRSKDKIIVYHPLNREGFKGTNEIRKAFEILKEKYKHNAEFIIKGRMPFDQYINFVQNVDIVVDQAYCVTCGMGALNAMAQGKVVLVGNAADWKTELDKFCYLSNIPKFDLGHDVDEMVNNISYLIENKDKLVEYGKASREYVVKYHSAKKVAAGFLKLYTENL